MSAPKTPGALMAAELLEAPGVFARAATQDAGEAARLLQDAPALYTVARGSSDAAANVLAYELMRETGLPVTSLPPSVFSIGQGVRMAGAGALILSQSGASDDLVRTARGLRAAGGRVVAITNVAGSPVEAEAEVTLPIGAGEERAVPATKSVTGAIGAGMALISALAPGYGGRAEASAEAIAALETTETPQADALRAALLRNPHVYVVGRDTGYGAAHELALKIKETCAIHAEAYSASEVLHGPLQLVTRPLLVILLDTGQPFVQESLGTAEARFRAAGGTVLRLSPADLGPGALTPAAAAALMLMMVYPVILGAARALGHDPDAPATLSKVTQTT
ncbi:SIS domain-containing protein [Pseudoroseicyclus sp. CXY001]|uniref:SIS domain-containing protein n=1 Tax=Pseudoroseicyclus sp. CXY001 TaxID=3242492 RepID=UPI0035709A6A